MSRHQVSVSPGTKATLATMISAAVIAGRVAVADRTGRVRLASSMVSLQKKNGPSVGAEIDGDLREVTIGLARTGICVRSNVRCRQSR